MKIGGFLSKYLKKEDFPAPQSLTIERVDEEDVGGDVKLVLYVAEKPQGLVLGKTTIGEICEIVGCAVDGDADTDDWIGHQIVAFADPSVMYGGKKVGGIRFRAPKRPQASRPAATADKRARPEQAEHDDGP